MTKIDSEIYFGDGLGWYGIVYGINGAKQIKESIKGKQEFHFDTSKIIYVSNEFIDKQFHNQYYGVDSTEICDFSFKETCTSSVYVMSRMTAVLTIKGEDIVIECFNIGYQANKPNLSDLDNELLDHVRLKLE